MDYPYWMAISQKIKLSDIIDKGGATRTATNNSGLRGAIGRSGIKLGLRIILLAKLLNVFLKKHIM